MDRLVRPRLLFAATLAAAGTIPATAQLEVTPPPPIVGARQLALSPDGQRLAFTYQGDVWVAPAAGGRAIPVTNHVEMDEAPVWSPDGKWIAFTSNRFGNREAFVVPADGGATRRLTWHTGDDVPTDWTPDGKHLVMAGTRESGYAGLHLLELASGRVRQILHDNFGVSVPQVSPDGRRVAYLRLGFGLARPRYSGSNASQLWVAEVNGQNRRALRDTQQQHLWPRFGPNGTLFAVTSTERTPSSGRVNEPVRMGDDNAARTPNVYAIDERGAARRLTDFVGGSGVRYLAVARETGAIAFEVDGNLYRREPNGRPEPIAITAVVDDKTTLEERQVLTSGASAGAIDPKGERVVFELQSDLWLVPVKKGKGPNADDAVRLTDYAGLDEDPIWSPDGASLVFASDRDGSRQLYRLTVADRKIERVTRTDRDVVLVRLMPGGKSLSYWQSGPGGGLFRLPLAGGAPERVIDLPREFRWGSSADYAWSPDERYVAYIRRTRSTRNLWVFDTQTKRDENITRLNASFQSPAWSPDGKYLYYAGNADGWGIYALPLQPEAARPSEIELKYERPKETPKIEIDWTDFRNRIRRLVATSVPSSLTPDPTNGEIYYLAEGDLWRVGYNGEETRRLTTGGGIGSFGFTADQNQAFFVRGGALNVIAVRPNNLPITNVSFRADFVRDLRAVRQAAFNQFWREYNRSFYDANFHGRNWAEIRTRYEPLLASVGHRNEFALVLGKMVGELDASHAEVGPGPGNPGSGTTAHLGVEIDTNYDGPGLRVKAVPTGTPGSFAATRIQPGEYILEVNGKAVRADEALYRDVLNNEVGRELTMLVNGSPTKDGARTVKYRAMSQGEWRGLLFQNILEARRKRVEEASNGQLAYLHISGMGGGNFEQFQREAWEFIRGKRGVIIDVRNNGGGNISDRLIDQIERRPHSFYVDRDGEPELAPDQSWDLPTVVLHAESSLSNAEMFPYAMRQRGLASTVGRRTPGYVIWTYGLTLVDGTSARMPTAGVYRLDGTPLENDGQRPDIEVDISPEQFFAGEDPQLERAIREVLRKVR